MTVQRFCLRREHVPNIGSLKTMFIHVDDACSNNGSTDPNTPPHGGFAFVFKPGAQGTFSEVLEKRGPAGGDPVVHTSNRAELRAVLAALAFREWSGEGWEKLVFVTDSEYVAKGATEWMRGWTARDWRTSGGKRVANRDMWEALSGKMGKYAAAGCEISFWAVPWAWNVEADQAAKKAAESGKVKDEYRDTPGVLV